MLGYCRKTCAALLLILFAGYWSCVTLFPHAHRVDGFVIVHSHPFSGAANGTAPQNHTPQQFQLIAHLSLLVMVAAVALSFVARLLGVRYVFRMMRPVGCLRPAIRTCLLWAPPVCLIDSASIRTAHPSADPVRGRTTFHSFSNTNPIR